MFLQHRTQRVIDGQMQFLHVGCHLRRNCQAYVADFLQDSSRFSGHGYDRKSSGLCHSGGVYHIYGITGCADCRQNITAPAIAVYLLGKYQFRGHII